MREMRACVRACVNSITSLAAHPSRRPEFRLAFATREELAAAVKMTPPFVSMGGGWKIQLQGTLTLRSTYKLSTTLCLGALSDTRVPRHDGNFATAAALDEVHLAPINGSCVRLCCGLCGKLKVNEPGFRVKEGLSCLSCSMKLSIRVVYS